MIFKIKLKWATQTTVFKIKYSNKMHPKDIVINTFMLRNGGTRIFKVIVVHNYSIVFL